MKKHLLKFQTNAFRNLLAFFSWFDYSVLIYGKITGFMFTFKKKLWLFNEDTNCETVELSLQNF